ncbi:MAG: NYN domain-containing protein [Proteobacteria bacterium]|nr:NYN domain-containing protein [Pseudomonadota bacterium]MCP4917003.1 NYN domain-containing protein [Pseudomonadota bacterium]
MEPSIAVLIDFENIAAGCEKEGLGKVDVGLIMNRLREKGRVLTARSYADWGRYARYKKGLLFENVMLFELSAHGMGDKNRADVALVVDCMELAFTRDYIDTYVVVSGDSDFTPLIQKLREMNKRVMGVGTRRSTSRLIVEACDEFIFYDTLRGNKTTRTRRGREESGKTLTREEAMELVTEVLAAHQRDDPSSIHASRVKELILRKEPAFSESDLGFSSFGRFIEFCGKEGIISVEKDRRAGGYQVTSADGDIDQKKAEPLREYSPTAKPLYELLVGESLDPLTPALQAWICDEIVSNVEDRKKRKRRVNLQWVTQDVVKKGRANDPVVLGGQVKGLIDGLHGAGVFRHTDGEPIRSFFAAFALTLDGPTLLKTLRVASLNKLRALGTDLTSCVPDLAEILLGDREMTREIEELIAWEIPAAPVVAKSNGDEPAAEEKPKRKRKPRKKKSEEAAPVEAAEAAVEAAPEAAEAAPETEAAVEAAPEAEVVVEAPPEKPKTKRRKRKTKAETEAAKAEAAAKAETAEAAPAEEAPKAPARKRRAVRKKKTEESPAAAE